MKLNNLEKSVSRHTEEADSLAKITEDERSFSKLASSNECREKVKGLQQEFSEEDVKIKKLKTKLDAYKLLKNYNGSYYNYSNS